MKLAIMKTVRYRIKFILISTTLLIASNAAFADEIAPLDGASKWIAKILISIAFSVLAPIVMFNLWQFHQGHKDAREIAKPILVTAAIVGTPAAALLMKSAMGY